MAYTSGTAANYKDLLAVMTTFAAANGWVVMEQSESKVFLKGTGDAGLDAIFVGVECYESVGAGYFNWEITGAFGYLSGRSFKDMPHANPLEWCFAYFWNQSIPYWMVATPRRIIVVAKVSTTYQMVHLGLGTPVGTTAQYPYPLLIGGSGGTGRKAQNYSASSAAFWNTLLRLANVDQANGGFVSPGGAWHPINSNTMWTNNTFNSRAGCISSPYYSQISNLVKSLDGSYLLDQMYIVGPPDTCKGVLASVEGLFRVSGFQNTAENIITVGGINYLVVPDTSRASISDFCALRLN